MTSLVKTLLGLICLLLALGTAQAATLTVTNNADTGAGSLRDTIAAAAAGDTIAFAASLNGQTITLLSQLAIDKHLNFVGNGVGNTTISGNNLVRLFNVGESITATWTDLTLTQGRADLGGCILGTIGSVLTLTRVTAHACTATSSGGALYGNTINITDSTISSNTASSGGGG